MATLVEAASGAATSAGEITHWIEEALAREGGGGLGLYLVAEGAPEEAQKAVKALRDEFCGRPAPKDVHHMVQGLQSALEAAHALLASKSTGIGVACVAAALSPSGELVMVYSGTCQAHLFRAEDSALERLTPRQHNSPGLGVGHPPLWGQEFRQLAPGDVLILCSGTVADAVRDEQMEALAHRVAVEGADVIAQALVQRATQDDPSIRATALVLLCQPGRAREAVPPTPMLTQPPAREPPLPQAILAALGQPPVPQARPRLAQATRLPSPSRWPLPILASGVMVVALLALSGIGLLTAPFWGQAFTRGPAASLPQEEGLAPTKPERDTPGEYAPASGARDSRSSPSALGPTEPAGGSSPLGKGEESARAWRRVDVLWSEGDSGNIPALQEIVVLLEQLQVQTPQDPRVDEKLRVARMNLAFRQKLQEVATYWGRGETSAETVASWGHIVEIMEALYRVPLPPQYALVAKEKLYSAHVNYGTALEAAKRSAEAVGNYQRARQIDPSRVEANTALARIR